MAQQRPPVVAADPHHPHKVIDWKVPLRVDGAPVTVEGELDWKGFPTLSRFVIALIVLAGTVGVALAVAMAVALGKEHLATRVEHEPAPVSDSTSRRSRKKRTVDRQATMGPADRDQSTGCSAGHPGPDVVRHG